jgi:hypothetical protein
MATYTNVSLAKTATLVASTVDTVSFNFQVDMMVVNMDASNYIWVASGVNPTVAGDNCIPIPPSTAVQLPFGGTDLRLISAGTPQYTVISM